MSTNDTRPYEPPRSYRPRIVVKLRDAPPARVATVALPRREGEGGQWAPLRQQFPQATISSNYPSVSPDRLRSLMAAARENAGGRELPNLLNFVSISCPPGTKPEEVLAAVRRMENVEAAYIQAPPAPPPAVSATDDPRSGAQGYLNSSPQGIDARCGWTVPGGDGRGVGFVDCEQGWTLNHEDLSGAGITLISGVNAAFPGHGTAVLGEILSQDNTRGCIGITPSVRARVVSQHRTASTYNTGDAIINAAAGMNRGDVLLLEAQVRVTNAAGTLTSYMPVESELDTWAAIFVATLFGIVVVEAAGNGNNDLDLHRDPTYGYIFKRGHADFRESYAIMVGAATSAAPHARAVWNAAASSGSNYGSRIDCFGWGMNIETTGDGFNGNAVNTYTSSFSGTSGASPIVTGAAISLQGMRKATGRGPYTATALRTLLSDRTANTASANPATDRIGVMPDICALALKENYKHPVGDFPMPRGNTRYA